MQVPVNPQSAPLQLPVALADDIKAAVVGVDFGTAFSGISYAYKADRNIQSGAPTALEPLETKVPTAILLMDDGTWLFGHAALEAYSEMIMEAKPGEELKGQLYKRFKMVLNGQTTGLETLTAVSVAGQPTQLLGLVVKTLTALRDYAIDRITTGYSVPDLMEDIQWVLTVPAIWNDFGKAFMRRAAFLAGMISSEDSENLMLVFEPEGASLAVHVGALQCGHLKTGCSFMVLDCGGGTVDITTYKVVSTSPTLLLDSIADPVGGPWGGEYVNDAFGELLKDLLGSLYTPQENYQTFHMIMAEFETVKRAFVPTENPRTVRLRDVLTEMNQLEGLAAAYNARHATGPQILMGPNNLPALLRGFLTMSAGLMLSLFEHCLSSTEVVVETILTAKPQVSAIIVVGGFGSSKVLTSRISAKFASPTRQVMLCSPSPQGAIAHGAVWFGLYKNIIHARIARWSYGVEMRINGVDHCFCTVVNRGQELLHDHKGYVQGYHIGDATTVVWRIFRSDLKDPSTISTRGSVHAEELGYVTVDCSKHDRKQHGYLTFSGPEIKAVFFNADGQRFTTCIKVT